MYWKIVKHRKRNSTCCEQRAKEYPALKIQKNYKQCKLTFLKVKCLSCITLLVSIVALR